MSAPGFAPAIGVQPKSILVPTDFTAASEKALRHAVAIARFYGSRLYSIHVVNGPPPGNPAPSETTTRLALRNARAAERKLIESGALAGLRHEVIIRDGDTWKQIEDIIQRQHIDLVVVGEGSGTASSGFVLGSVAEQIFREASCPVLTFGPRAHVDDSAVAPGDLRPILFPTDFGARSLQALPYALSCAERRETRAILFHALSAIPEGLENGGYAAEEVVTMRKAARAAAVKRLRALIPPSFSGIESVCVAEFGEPSKWILHCAEELNAELIIMGLNHDTLQEDPAASIAYRIVCGAPCPVMTVRPI